MWAFLLIALCMLYPFRSIKILICSLILNIIPLIITAGVMGWDRRGHKTIDRAGIFHCFRNCN